MKEFLNGKKILFIAPIFNGYEQHIISELEDRGGTVHFFGESLKEPYIYYLSKFKSTYYLYDIFQKKYLQKILDKIDDEYDYLFVIRGEFLTQNLLQIMFEKSSINLKIMYQWDELQTLPNIETVVHLFDRVLSFDYDDCKNYGFEYLPLFITNNFASAYPSAEKLYDFSFVGVYNSHRNKYINILKDFANNKGFSYCFKLRIGFLRFIIKKAIDKSFKLDFNDVIFKNMSLDEVSKIIQSSNIVLDIVRETQTGLTMRTFEALGSGVKLLTNNQNIKKETFYEANNICIFDELNKDFILSPFLPKNMKEYCIESWIDKIFC